MSQLLEDIGQYKRKYEQDGYVVLKNSVPAKLLAELVDEINQQIDARVESFRKEGISLDPASQLGLAHRALAIQEQHSPFLQGWKPDIHRSNAAQNLMRSDFMRRIMQTFLGNEVSGDGKLVLRMQTPRNTRSTVMWHQDAAYVNDFGKDHGGVKAEDLDFLTIWMPLVPVDEKSGCLQVIPGAHKWGIQECARDEENHLKIPDHVFARGNPTPVPMKPGDALILHNLNLHTGFVNQSDGVRWSVDTRYFVPDRAPGLSAEQKRTLDFMVGLWEKTMGLKAFDLIRNGRTV